MENELKSLARERIWFLEQVRRKAEKSVIRKNKAKRVVSDATGTAKRGVKKISSAFNKKE